MESTSRHLEAGPGQSSQLAMAFRSLDQSSRRLEAAYRQLQQTNERLRRRLDALDGQSLYLHELLSRMHDGVIAVDHDGSITTVNRAAERVLGLRAADVVGRPHEGVVRHADGSPTLLAMALGTGQACSDIEREVAAPGGAVLRLSSSAAPLYDSRGKQVGAVEIFSDLTELRRLEERLEQADRLAIVGQRAAQVAHEIRNPLTAIEGFASLLMRDVAVGDRRREFAEKIVDGARYLNRVVSNMLILCQGGPLRLCPTSARALLEEAVAFVQEERRHGGRAPLGVERSYEPEADLLEADPDQLRQALLNVLLNAEEAMGPRGTLRLATRPVHDGTQRAELRIGDTGPGIPDDVRPRVFEPFFTTKPTGTGLGLAIVEKIVRLHGGEFDLRGGPGGGTTAVFILPRHGPDTPRPACPRENQWPSSERSLLTTTP